MMKKFLLSLALACASTCEARAADAPPMPWLTGKLVFHRYTEYKDEDGSLWMYDFAAQELVELSRNWPLHHAINAHFSPDGHTLVFMAKTGTTPLQGEWDIFTWTLGDPDSPANLPRDLTADNGMRDEDPKYLRDGRIVFKQDGRIVTMNADGSGVRSLCIKPPGIERSAPFATSDGQGILFSEGFREESDIYVSDANGDARRALATQPGLQEYYPIAWGENMFLYTRWLGAAEGQHFDQIYTRDLSDAGTGPGRSLPFNVSNDNTSDPFPINDRLIFFSRGGTNYDLFLGDAHTGESWSLSELVPGVSINLGGNQKELGAAYLPGPLTIRP